MNNISSGNKRFYNFDKAIVIACKTFDERHPKEEQPTWLKYCMLMRGNMPQKRRTSRAASREDKFLLLDLYWSVESIPVCGEVHTTYKSCNLLCNIFMVYKIELSTFLVL